MTPRSLFAAFALLPTGWARDVLLEWNDVGRLIRVDAGVANTAAADVAAGPVLPGMPNLHSHAFQRAFAGLTEHRQHARHGPRHAAHDDSFWTWRDLMYRFALKVSPDQLEDIATLLYIEMLQAGYTTVCEFHYLHHDPAGQPYADPAEMALRLVAAAHRAGIGLTLLPVLYQQAGFGAVPARPDQRRFINSVDALLDIGARIQAHGARTGLALHSLRAVGPAALAEAVGAVPADMPIHIHIAEQQQEVDDCLAWSGQRPVQWLLDHAAVDARWCLVHATHIDASEIAGLAASKAVAGLCPSTEADLGDGVFPALPHAAAQGVWGIGSDSHIGVDACDELRLLEYSQRLAHQRRNLLASDAHPQVADTLWLGAVQGGAAASGRSGDAASGATGLAVGQPADIVVLDAGGARAGLASPILLASHVFGGRRGSAIRDVWVAGTRRIDAGRHALEATACDRFVATRTRLMADS